MALSVKKVRFRAFKHLAHFAFDEGVFYSIPYITLPNDAIGKQHVCNLMVDKSTYCHEKFIAGVIGNGWYAD